MRVSMKLKNNLEEKLGKGVSEEKWNETIPFIIAEYINIHNLPNTRKIRRLLKKTLL